MKKKMERLTSSSTYKGRRKNEKKHQTPSFDLQSVDYIMNYNEHF